MARLLWRGSLYLETGDTDSISPGKPPPSASTSNITILHGLAIVASSFSLPSTTAFNNLEPDDPFSSSSSPFKTDTSAELCLDIEMLRNGPLYLPSRRARVIIAGPNTIQEEEQQQQNIFLAPTTKPRGRKALKKSIEMLRKGKQRAADVPELVYLDEEHDDNLSLFIDQRCQDTLEYFNNLFCKEEVDPDTGRTQFGIAVPLEKEDELGVSGNTLRKVVIYGQTAPGPNTSRPIMRLHVAKYRNKKDIGPRPDAPAPRENLFAQKLRRTVSQPALALKSKTLKSGSDSQGNIAPEPLHKAAVLPRSLSASSALTASHALKARNLFGRPKAGTLVKKSLQSNADVGITKAPLSNASPGRRGQKRPRLTAGGLRALEEAEEAENDVDETGISKDDKTDVFELPVKKMRNRNGSPTPSIATVRSAASTAMIGTKGPANKQKQKDSIMRQQNSILKRSMSMPPGQMDFGGRSQTMPPQAREASLAPTEITVNANEDVGSTALETRNKGTLRKILLSAMTDRSCGRDNEDFKEVFSVAYKGLQCSFRRSIKTEKLNKDEVTQLTEKHLSMYL